MPSALDVAKRELVKVLNLLAAKYKVKLDLTRDSAEKQVHQANVWGAKGARNGAAAGQKFLRFS